MTASYPKAPGTAKADRIRQLVKEWLKSGDDRLPHELQDLLQSPINPETFKFVSRRIVERYEEGSLTIHFHVTSSAEQVGGYRDVPEYCAVAQFLKADDHGAYDGSVLSPDERSVGRYGIGEVEHSMLVSVVKLAHDLKSLIPTGVRLQALNDCLSRCGDAIKPVSANLLDKSRRRTTDGEHIPGARFGGRIVFDKLPHDVVQGGTDVVEAVADKDTQLLGRLGQSDSPHGMFRVTVYLRNDLALALFQRPDHAQYRVEMFLCPDNFQKSAVESMAEGFQHTHELTPNGQPSK